MSDEATFEDEIKEHFPTTFMHRRYKGREHLNDRLSNFLLQLETISKNKTDGTSNIGGFHSDTKLLAVKDESIAELRRMINESINAYLAPLITNECVTPPKGLNLQLWGWGLIMRDGDSNNQHMHPDANISGVYYIAIPKVMETASVNDPYGCISFVDPRPRANCIRLPNQFAAHAVNPIAGEMILFPSYYEHFVTPFKGAGVRMCVAFNAKIT